MGFLIIALDLVPQCFTYSDGRTVGQEIERAIGDGNVVTLSFHGVTNVPSSFVNGLVIPLIDRLSVSIVKSKLRIVDSTRQINSLIRSRVEETALQAVAC